MPAILCEKCISRLKVAHDFCRSANLAEKHLRKFISKISLDFREVTKTLPMEEEEDYVLMEEFDAMDPQVLLEEPEEIVPAPPPPPTTALEQTTVIPKRNLKIEETDEMENEEIELMVEEPVEEIGTIGKEEALGSETQMEEFHEIIQDEDGDADLYLDENTYEELQLYETEDGDIYENQEHAEEEEDEEDDGEEEIIADHIDTYSVTDNGEQFVKMDPEEQKKVKNRKTTRNLKRSSGESAASKIEGKSNICIKCNKDFSTKTNLMRHMSTHDGVKPFTCPTCGKGFTQNGSLKQHIFIHTGEKPHVCHVCQRGFTQSKSLIFHMRRHTGEKPFNCEECGINFRQKDGLKHHIQKYHGEGQLKREAHICPVCERVLSSKYALATHIKKHQSKTEEQEAEILGRCLQGSAKLDKSSGKKVKTESQEYSSTSANSASNQMIDITDEMVEKQPICHAGAGVRMKQFQCGKCFKSFHIKRNLFRHLRNHDVSTLELHECTDCGIGFDTKRSLKLHRLRDHKDVVCDLNNCEYCDAPFASVADLSEHIANEHDAIDQNCPHCSEHFDSQKLYYDHLLEHEHMLDT
ncbi:gastrula zinc finger protein XlCGF57.1-like isoform X2 [Episyrphus balteatus]|nr:gastrula zinc finger protein XlCGF57.1-like isoform X2 [Episyrphus balteatus]